MRISKGLVLSAAAAVLAAVPGFAQVSTARLEGIIQDQSGAVIPSASIEAVNVRTKVRVQTTSDADGRYIFPSLAPSEYTVTVEAAGFRKAIRHGLILNVGFTVTEVINLEVGAVTESVTVQANTVRVQTADAQLGRAITLRDIEVLPQIGRDPVILAIFNPGVQIDTSSGTSYSRVNGTRQGSNNTTLDGIEANDMVAPRLGLSMTPSTSDTVEEFRVVTNGGKAEYGRSGGAQVQMITRSGTNAFHGGGWDYLRNTVLNANSFASNYSGSNRPKYIRNIFGGKFEGPILRDRTFFFVNYEGNRTRQQVSRNRTVLTPEAKQGLFRWRSPNSTAIQSFDIARNDPRSKGIDPEMNRLIGLLPNPNNTDLGDGFNTAGFRFNAPANSYNDQFTLKVDHNISSGHRAFFRWTWFRTRSIDTTNGYEARFPGAEDGWQGGNRGGWSAGSDWTLSSTVVNELRVGNQNTTTNFVRPRPPKWMAVPNTFTHPEAIPTGYSQGRNPALFQITDNLSKIHGKHTLKAGVQLRLMNQKNWRDDYIWPVVNLSRSTYGNTPPATVGPAGSAVIGSADRQRFESLYNDLLGRMSDVFGRYYSDLVSFLPDGTSRLRQFQFKELGLFFQDDWKITPRLTLNLGLRYERFGAPMEGDGLQGGLDKAAEMNLVNKLTDIRSQKGLPYYNADNNNIAPRVGFAWDVRGNGKTAIRSSWGVFYDRMINATLTPADLNIPGLSTDVRVTPNSAAGSDRRISDGVPALPKPAAPSVLAPLDRQQTVFTMLPGLRTGYVMHSSFNIQQEIYRNTVIEAGYVSTRGVKLFMHSNLNQPRIYEDFLGAFQQLQAYRANRTPVPAGNTLVRLFGTADAALSTLGASNFENGAAGTVAHNLDFSHYTRYAAAGLPMTYLRNYPQFNIAYQGNNDGRSYYDSFQLSFRRQQGALKFNANYTFSKSLDNWPNEGNGTSNSSVMDWFNPRLSRALSDFDKPHSFNSSFIYTLPFGRNKRFLGGAARWVDSLLGGWEMGVLNIWQSGTVFDVSSGRSTGPNQGASAWANYSGDRAAGALERRGDGVYMFTEEMKSRFSFPEAGFVGNSGRNAFRGPRYFNTDASLMKIFRIRESARATFRAEGYNLFNNANFGVPGVSLTTPANLGKFSGTTTSARIVQMALRFDF